MPGIPVIDPAGLDRTREMLRGLGPLPVVCEQRDCSPWNVFEGDEGIAVYAGSVTVETKDVQVGTQTRNVQVPVVKMETRQLPVPSVGVENSQANAQ